MTFIHPIDDELLIAGQGTVADELLRQSAGRLHALLVAVGGGGLIAGMAAYLKALCPEVRIIGVEPVDSDAMARSLQAGRRVHLDSVGIFADGVAVREVGKLTFELCRRFVDEIITVDTDQICSAIRSNYQATRSIVEPAGALGLAGLKKYVRERQVSGQTLVAVNSGANMNFERLRYVAERTLIGEKQEALFAVTIPEQPGSLKRFCTEVLGERNLTEFNYRLAGREAAHIFVGISTRTSRSGSPSAGCSAKRLSSIDLTDNELARPTSVTWSAAAPEAGDERLFRFWFPSGLAPSPVSSKRWGELNISSSTTGCMAATTAGADRPGDTGSVKARLHGFLDNLGYRFVERRQPGLPAFPVSRSKVLRRLSSVVRPPPSRGKIHTEKQIRERRCDPS
jgi:threonine dehydratase